MIISLVVGIILGAAAVFFFIQNVALVTVTAFAWQLTAPLALILVLSSLVGVAVTLLVALPASIRDDVAVVKLRAALRDLEARLATAERERDALKATTYSSSTNSA